MLITKAKQRRVRFMDPAAVRKTSVLAPDFRAIHLAADSRAKELSELILRRWKQHGRLLAADIGPNWENAADVLSAAPRFQMIALESEAEEIDALVEEILVTIATEAGEAALGSIGARLDMVSPEAINRAGFADLERVLPLASGQQAVREALMSNLSGLTDRRAVVSAITQAWMDDPSVTLESFGLTSKAFTAITNRVEKVMRKWLSGDLSIPQMNRLIGVAGDRPPVSFGMSVYDGNPFRQLAMANRTVGEPDSGVADGNWLEILFGGTSPSGATPGKFTYRHLSGAPHQNSSYAAYPMGTWEFPTDDLELTPWTREHIDQDFWDNPLEATSATTAAHFEWLMQGMPGEEPGVSEIVPGASDSGNAAWQEMVFSGRDAQISEDDLAAWLSDPSRGYFTIEGQVPNLMQTHTSKEIIGFVPFQYDQEMVNGELKKTGISSTGHVIPARNFKRWFDHQTDSIQLAQTLAQWSGQKALKSRAKLIAQTETMSAANGGARLAMQTAQTDGLLPPNARIEWIVTPDDRLCDRCRAMDRQTVPLINGAFTEPGKVGGGVMYPPLHPRCRCTIAIAPDVDDGESLRFGPSLPRAGAAQDGLVPGEQTIITGPPLDRVIESGDSQDAIRRYNAASGTDSAGEWKAQVNQRLTDRMLYDYDDRVLFRPWVRDEDMKRIGGNMPGDLWQSRMAFLGQDITDADRRFFALMDKEGISPESDRVHTIWDASGVWGEARSVEDNAFMAQYKKDRSNRFPNGPGSALFAGDEYGEYESATAARSDMALFQRSPPSKGMYRRVADNRWWIDPDNMDKAGSNSSASAISVLDPRVRLDPTNQYGQTWRHDRTSDWADVDRLLQEIDDREPGRRRTEGALEGWLFSGRGGQSGAPDRRSTGGTYDAKAALIGPALDDIVRGWATSSNATHQAQLLQEAARQQFNLKDSFRWTAQPDTKSFIAVQDRADGFYRATVQTMYDETQQQLAQMGYQPGDTIRAYRGVSGDGARAALESMQGEEAQYFSGAIRPVFGRQDLIRSNAQIPQRPLSSISVDPNIADRFMKGQDAPTGNELLTLLEGIAWDDMDWPEEKLLEFQDLLRKIGEDTGLKVGWGVKGGMFEMDVPIEQICSTSMSGVGCLGEKEMVILGAINRSTVNIGI